MKLFLQFKLLLAWSTLAVTSYSFADSPDSTDSSFYDILKLAQKAHSEKKAIEQQYFADIGAVEQAKGSVYPTVNLSTKYSRVDRSSISSFMYGANSRTEGSTFDWALGVEQPLFSFGRFTRVVEIAKLTEKSLALKAHLDLDMYFVQVLMAYGDALMAQGRLSIAKKSQGHLYSVLEFTKIEARGGGRDKVDLLRARAALQMIMAEEKQAAILATTSIEKLKILLDIPLSEPLTLSNAKNPEASFLKVTNQPEKKPASVMLKMMQANIDKEQIDYEKSYYFPSFSLFGQVSGSALDISPSALPKQSPSDAFGSDRRDYAVGVRMDWNLFNGFATTASYHAQVARAEKSRLDYEKSLRNHSAELKEAEANIESSRSRYEASVQQKSAAALAFSQANEDYQNGSLRLTDLLDADKEYRQADFDLTRTWIEWIMAAANLRLAQGQRVMEDNL